MSFFLYQILVKHTSITLLPNNGYYAKSHIVQAMNLKQDDSRLQKPPKLP